MAWGREAVKLTEIRRKLYKRGSSYETTIPMPLLFALDKNRKHDVVFKFNPETSEWTIRFDERGGSKRESRSKK